MFTRTSAQGPFTRLRQGFGKGKARSARWGGFTFTKAPLFAVFLLASAAHAQNLLVDDSLRDASNGSFRVSGGSFTSEGWMVTGLQDHVIWHIPTSPKGAAEFSLKGILPNECRAGLDGWSEFFHMYDWMDGDADNQYAPPPSVGAGYRNNPYKHFIRKIGCADARPGKLDALELGWTVQGNFEEPDSQALSWDPNVTYRFREEWGPDGAGNTYNRLYRDGQLLVVMSQPGVYAPAGHSVRIAASNRGTDSNAPPGAVFSDVKVWDDPSGGDAPPPPPPPPPPGPGAGQAELYGIFEIPLTHSTNYGNPFRDVSLDATFAAPSGRRINFWGFYDGDGAGGQTGNVWKIRFMPDEVGTWSFTWGFSDGSGSGSGSFGVVDTGIPGPPRLDPRNPQVLVDARGNPIHWRGYGIKHITGKYSEPPPLILENASAFIREVIDPQVIGAGYNATYHMVPTGWPSGTWDSLWGDYTRYDLRAGHFHDQIMLRLHEGRIWTMSWITFGIQTTWEDLWGNYQPLMRYFVARYGAFYNYFMWSPTWEMWELTDWENRTNTMMNYLVSIDPWKRLQGAHDRALAMWQGWQSIQPRQLPPRTVFDGNNRSEGVEPGIAPYAKCVFGSEDIWEYCDGSWGKPRNGPEVRRGLWGELLANVLPLYDEQFSSGGPCAGAGNGEGEPFVKIGYDWWYANVNYREPGFQMLNGRVSAAARQAASGIPGRECVVYDEDGGSIDVDLSGDGAATFDVIWFDPSTGAEQGAGTAGGGAVRSFNPPFGGDVVLLLRGGAPPPPPPPPGGNPPPSVAITAPADGSTFMAGGTVTITVAADDGNGSVAKVEFFAGAVKLGEDADGSNGFSLAWGNAPGGLHTLTAVATDDGGASATSAAVTIVEAGLFRNPDNPTGVVNGLDYEYYIGTWDLLPDFDAMAPVGTGTVANFDILGARDRDESYGFRFRGYVSVPADGVYTFYTASDDGSKLYIGNTQVVDNDGLHGMSEQSGQIALRAGLHALTVTFFEKFASEGLEVRVAGSGIAKELIPASALFRVNAGGGTPPPPPPPPPPPGGDTVQPQLTWEAPPDGATVSGMVMMQGTATDNVAVARVEVLVSLVKVADATLNGAAWSYSFNSAAYANGGYNLSALAVDTSGNNARYTIRITISNAAGGGGGGGGGTSSTDSDADGLPDSWEMANFGNLSQSGAGDLDGDGLLNAGEFSGGTNPTQADSDLDGMRDGGEVAFGFNPLTTDQNGNGVVDGLDDWDGDGVNNQTEVAAGTGPGSVPSAAPTAPASGGGGGGGGGGCFAGFGRGRKQGIAF